VTKVNRFILSYSHKIKHVTSDYEEALRLAIDDIFPMRPDYARADLFARLAEKWQEYNGTGRRIFVTRTFRSWDAWYIRAPRPEESE
jgi:hypothetical protein